MYLTCQHTSCTPKQRRRKFCWEFSTNALPKDCLLVLVQTFKYKVRLLVWLADIGRDNFYVGFQHCMLSWREKSQHSCCMCVVIGKHQTMKTAKKCTKMYCQKCNLGLCTGQSFEVYHTKLKYWEESNIHFHWRGYKNLISVWRINCSGFIIIVSSTALGGPWPPRSGLLGTINFMILVSKFPPTMSDSKYT